MIHELLAHGPTVVNIGLQDFADALDAQHVPVVHVDWSPPPVLDDAVTAVLEALQ